MLSLIVRHPHPPTPPAFALSFSNHTACVAWIPHMRECGCYVFVCECVCGRIHVHLHISWPSVANPLISLNGKKAQVEPSEMWGTLWLWGRWERQTIVLWRRLQCWRYCFAIQSLWSMFCGACSCCFCCSCCCCCLI